MPCRARNDIYLSFTDTQIDENIYSIACDANNFETWVVLQSSSFRETTHHPAILQASKELAPSPTTLATTLLILPTTFIVLISDSLMSPVCFSESPCGVVVFLDKTSNANPPIWYIAVLWGI